MLPTIQSYDVSCIIPLFQILLFAVFSFVGEMLVHRLDFQKWDHVLH